MVTKTRVEHLNSERAKEFLDEMEEEDLKQNSNGNIPGFLTNFFQGSEQHIKVFKILFFHDIFILIKNRFLSFRSKNLQNL